MAKFETILATMLCINLMLVLGGIFEPDAKASEGNILTKFFKFNYTTNTGGFSDELSEESEGLFTGSFVKEGDSDFSFLDFVLIIKDLIGFLFNTITAPLQLFLNPNLNLPLQFRLMIGMPYSFLYLFTIIRFWRRGD